MNIAMFDIEASNLSANFGIVLTACIKPYGGPVKKFTKSTKTRNDKALIAEIIQELNKYDMIVTWYGWRYDVPFIKTRALMRQAKGNIDPRIRHMDLWDACRKLLKFTSNRLDTVSTDLGFADKTRISGDIWTNAMQGDKKALAYILDHNVKDVVVLEKVYRSFMSRGLLRDIKTIPRI